MENEKLCGKVKWFNNERGYGFITSGDKDYFAHFSEIKTDGFKSLTEGHSVNFIPSKSLKGASATQIFITDTAH